MTNPTDITDITDIKKTYFPPIFFKAALAAFVIFGGITLYVMEAAYLQNTFNATKFVIGSAIIGLVIGLLLGLKFKNRFADEDERRVIAFGFTIFVGLLFPLMTSLINRKLNFNSPKKERVEFFKLEPYGTSRVGNIEGLEHQVDGYSIFFIRDKNIERVRSQKAQFENKEKGDPIYLPISKGVLGFEYVTFPE